MRASRRKRLGSLAALFVAAAPACSTLLGANDPIELFDAASSPATGDGSTEPVPGNPFALDGGGPEVRTDAGSEPTIDSAPAPCSSTMPMPDACRLPPLPDAGGREAGGPPLTLIFPGAGLVVWGVTSDGYAIASDASTTYAVPLGGGSALRFPQVTQALAAGTTVFLWGIPQSSSPFVPLWIWNPGAGLSPTSITNFSAPNVASATSQLVYYVRDASADAGSTMTGTAVVGTEPAGAPVTTFPNAIIGLPAFDPYSPQFIPTQGATFFNVCTSATPSGCSIAAGSGALLATGVSSTWSVDPAGTQLLIAPPSGGGVILDVSSGQTVASFDADGGVLTGGTMFYGGAVYVSGGTLKMAQPPPGASVKAITTPAAALWTVSSTPLGGCFMDVALYSTSSLDGSGNGDIWFALLDLIAGGPPPMRLASAPAYPLPVVGGVIAWMEQISPTGTGSLLVSSCAVGPPAGPTRLSTNSLIQRTTPSGIVYDDAVQFGAGPWGHADLWQYRSGSSSQVAAQANLIFAVTPAGDRLLFGWDNGPDGAGIYAFALQ